MTWAKLDDRLYDDPRSEAAGLDAMGLFVLALSYMAAYRTDGWITAERLRRLAGRRASWLADKLVTAGWWERPEEGAEGSYRLLGWERFILPAEEAAERSTRAAAAGRKGGRARAERAASEERTDHEPTPEPRANLGLNPGDNLADKSEVRARNEAEALETGQATRAHPRARSRPDPNARDRADVRAHVGGGDPPGQRAIPFGPSPDAPATSTPIPASGKRAKKPGEPTAAERYIAAFVEGLEAGGRRITPPRASDGALLGRVAATHARTAAGSRIVGDALLAWIRNTATRFAKAITRPEMHRGGISAFGLQTWLDNGARAQAESFVPTDDDLDVDAANEGNPWHDPVPDFHERRPSASRAPQPRPDVTPEQAAAAIEWARSKGLMPRAPIGTPPPRERAHG